MTYKTGRLGRKFSRAGVMDPRGHWGTGVPASAGFMPERSPILQGEGYVFAGACPEGTKLVGVDVWGNPICEPVGAEKDLAIPTQHHQRSGRKPRGIGLKLSRQGAQRTRLKHGLLRRKR